MDDRTHKLRALMAQHGVKIKDVAKITGRAETTVRIWRCKHDARVIPENTLRMLELALGQLQG